MVTRPLPVPATVSTKLPVVVRLFIFILTNRIGGLVDHICTIFTYYLINSHQPGMAVKREDEYFLKCAIVNITFSWPNCPCSKNSRFGIMVHT